MKREQININGILDDWGYQRSNVAYQLNRHKGAPVLCVVNSLGGSVNEGIAISKLFEQHGDVVVRFVGCCASAATWMAFGAKEVEICEDSLWLVHQCSNIISIYKSMKIEDIDKTIKELESTKRSQEAINFVIAKKYADRCSKNNKTLQDVLQLMEEERWMSANEAYEWGFVDRIIPGINKMTGETKNLIAQNCAALNLPVPVFSADKAETSSIKQLVVDTLRSLFATPNVKPADEELSNEEEQPAQTTLDMNKYNNLNVVIGLVQPNDKGELVLNEEMLQKIENALAEAEIAKNTIADVTSTLDAVGDNIKSIEGAKNKALAIVTVMQNLPAMAPAGNNVPDTSDEKADKLKEIAKDPINEEVRVLFNQRNTRR